MNITQKHNLVLLKQLVKTDFKLRYQDSVLGFAWSLLNPLFMFLILYIVFDKFFGMGRMAGVEHYPVQLLLGIVIWNFFAESTSLGLGSIVGKADLLRKINFPKYIIVISGTISSLINLGLSLVVVFIFGFINGVHLSWMLILLPLPIIEMYAFALATSFLLSTLYVKFRDLGHIWGIITQGWFYATPVVYPLSMVIHFSPQIAKALLLFPPAQLIQDARYFFISPTKGVVDVGDGIFAPGLPTVWNYIDNPILHFLPLVFIAVLGVFAVQYFRTSAKNFAEEI
ncbi:MAG: ABC transporter permease [Candidatus Ancillula sp.]|jgi:ABC-2 type transport system permease protein|nr:ABC transporter permease [Candidatus Ancillula sp.]